MRTRSLAAFLFPTLLLLSLAMLASHVASAQETPNGGAPPSEGICDELVTATPGLHGLCVAFCEAQECERVVSPDGPFEQCTPSSPKLFEQYNRIRSQDDPDMPCTRAECPCWTTEELSALPFPSDISGVAACFVVEPGAFVTAHDTWGVGENYTFARQVSISTSLYFPSRNPPLTAQCKLQHDFTAPPIFRAFSITYDEYATCTADVVTSGRERGLDCWPEPF